LNSAGAAKLKVVKEVKTLLGLGLKDAKELVDGAPGAIKEGVPKEEAEKIKEALEGSWCRGRDQVNTLNYRSE
jgi:large subunit ribosomal protein L7/L12